MGGSHLISHDDNGIEIQVYCSMIACLLINLWTGSAPNKRMFEMISYYFQGLAIHCIVALHRPVILSSRYSHFMQLSKRRAEHYWERGF